MVKAALLTLLLPAVLLGALPRIERPVTDEHGMLSAQEKEVVAQSLVAVRSEQQVQLAVLLVPTTEGQPIEDFAAQVFQTWKGGEAGQDNGVLLVVARDDRRMRLEVGYGVETRLTDGEARALLDAQGPLMREGRLADALLAIVAGVREQVSEAEPLSPVAGAHSEQAHDHAHESEPADARPLVYGMLVLNLVLGGLLARAKLGSILLGWKEAGVRPGWTALSPEDRSVVSRGAMFAGGGMGLAGALAAAQGLSPLGVMLGCVVMLALVSCGWHQWLWGAWPWGVSLLLAPISLVILNESEKYPHTDLPVLLGFGSIMLIFAATPLLVGTHMLQGILEGLEPHFRRAARVSSGPRPASSSGNQRPTQKKRYKKGKRRAGSGRRQQFQGAEPSRPVSGSSRPSFLWAFFSSLFSSSGSSSSSSSSSSSFSSFSSSSSSSSSYSSSSSSSWSGGGGSSGGGGASSSW